ncbi:MAG: DNA polymerase III subunit gamma/tau [Planctomycetes bacterium]|nr:DNA polymerase III subunit gamma/tau [Planctomycetota bacterium]
MSPLRSMANSSEPDDAAPYQVLARRFRPRSFPELVGQDEVLASLRHALASGRIPHALVFAGSRGVGKTTSARILARALNCERGPTPDPCGTCATCRSLLDGTNPDVIEIDAASHNGVDDIRELREHVGFATMGSRYRVYILDEAHMLSTAAWNAFLKTLEEPPPNVVFVLATTEVHKIPATIRSRCQVLFFRRVGTVDIERRLAALCEREGVALPAAVLAAIAQDSHGGMRDAETTLERVLPLARSLGAGFDLDAYWRLAHRVGLARCLEVAEALAQGDARTAVRFARELASAGLDERAALGDVVGLLRAALLLAVDGAESDLVDHQGEVRTRLQALAKQADPTRLDAMLQAAIRGRARLRDHDDRQLVLELTFLHMARAGELPTLGQLVAELRAGEPGSGTATPQAAPAMAPASPAVPRPQAAAAAVPPAAPAADLRARLLARLVQLDKRRIAEAIERCVVRDPDAGGVVRVEPQTDQRLFLDRLGYEGVKQDLKRLLSELCGKEVRVLVVAPQPTAAPALAPHPAARNVATPPPPGSVQSPAVRKVVEKFEGEILDVTRAADAAEEPNDP